MYPEDKNYYSSLQFVFSSFILATIMVGWVYEIYFLKIIGTFLSVFNVYRMVKEKFPNKEVHKEANTKLIPKPMGPYRTPADRQF